MTRWKNATFIIFALLAGITLDFVIYGVAKIIWLVIYVPIYCVAGKSFFNYREALAWPAIFAMCLGALSARIIFVGRHGLLEYQMFVSSSAPLTLAFKEWPQILVVSGDKLWADLQNKKGEFSVRVETVSDYGCVRSSAVLSIDGVDVANDKDASWSWKTDKAFSGPQKNYGPGEEDQKFPWCRYQFYRSG